MTRWSDIVRGRSMVGQGFSESARRPGLATRNNALPASEKRTCFGAPSASRKSLKSRLNKSVRKVAAYSDQGETTVGPVETAPGGRYGFFIMQHLDEHKFPALAWTQDGQPFHPAPNCVGWRVYRSSGRGRPSLVHTEDGPLHLDLDCDYEALRECAGTGRYNLCQVDAGGAAISSAPVAVVTITERAGDASETLETTYVELALKTQEKTIEVLRELLTQLVIGTANLQKATAELLTSGSDAVSIASGAGLPEHVAALMPGPAQKNDSGIEGVLNSPVVASALMGLAQALRPSVEANKGGQGPKQEGNKQP